MKRDSLYDILDLLDDDIIEESSDAHRSKWKLRLIAIGVLVAVLILANVVMSLYNRPLDPAEGIGSTPGILRDGVYYVYPGSEPYFPYISMRSPNPNGIWAYTPGKGLEQLVRQEDRSVGVIFHTWDANADALYYTDMHTLWRLDLATREETVLLTADQTAPAPNADRGKAPPELKDTRKALVGYWTGQLSDEEVMEIIDTDDYPTVMLLEEVTDETVTVNLFSQDGAREDTLLTLDAKTGEWLGPEVPRPEDQWTTTYQLGDRTIVEDWVESREGVYDTWDYDEDGQRLLPDGWFAGGISRLQDGLYVSYLRREEPDEDGNFPTLRKSYLFTAEGNYDIPETDENGLDIENCMAVLDHWLIYSARQDVSPHSDPYDRELGIYSVWARDLRTNESTLLLPQAPMSMGTVVTDGTWFYLVHGNATDCYRLDRAEDGRPIAMTLIEENI